MFSCSEDTDTQIETTNSDNITDLEIKSIVSKATLTSPKDLEEKFFKEGNFILKPIDEANIKKANNQIQGPFTTTISGTATATLSNQKITWSGNEYPSPGIYIADVHTHSVLIQLPPNAAGFVSSVTNPGYNDYSSQTIGYSSSNVTQNGVNYLYVKTFTMKIRWNVAGQTINQNVPVSPYGLGPKTVTYSYVIF